MKSFRFAFIFCGIIAVLAELSIAADKPKNIILFIGDGMGMGHVQTASLQKAMNEKKLPIESRLTFESFPVTGYLTTHSETNIVTDSAAAGTALACGVKTKNGMIGKSGDGKDVDSIAVLAKKKGKAVGIVTSVCLDDALHRFSMPMQVHARKRTIFLSRLLLQQHTMCLWAVVLCARGGMMKSFAGKVLNQVFFM